MLAQNELGSANADVDLYLHGRNIDWLASLYLASGCQNSLSATSESPSAADFESSTLQGKEDLSALLPKNKIPIVVVAIVTALAAVAICIHKLSRSFFLRLRQTERLPRYPISLSLDLTFTDPDGNMQQASGDIIDISQGGVKLSWPDPPPSKTIVTITLLATQRLGQVMWSNNHCAGVMFDTQLSRPELKSLMETNAPQ